MPEPLQQLSTHFPLEYTIKKKKKFQYELERTLVKLLTMQKATMTMVDSFYFQVHLVTDLIDALYGIPQMH